MEVSIYSSICQLCCHQAAPVHKTLWSSAHHLAKLSVREKQLGMYRGNHCISSCSFVVLKLIWLYALCTCMLKLAIFAAYCVFAIAQK